MRAYFMLFHKYRTLVVRCAAVSLVVSIVITVFLPPTYTATSTIQIDREPAKVIRSQETVENQTDPQFYATQYELLKSRALAERVVSTLALATRSGFVSSGGGLLSRLFARGEGAEPESDRLQRLAADRVMKELAIQPIVTSRIVKISVSDRDPRLAQEISKAFAENFVAMTLDRRFASSAYARGFLEDKLKQVKLKLEESETQVVAYAQKEGIVNVDDKLSVSGANLKALNDSLSAATADRIKAEQLWAQARSDNGEGLPQVMGDKLVQAAREKRAQLMADYQDKLGVMKPDFPEMKQMHARIVEYDRQIARQIELVKKSIKAQYEATLDQEQSFVKKIDTLKAEVLDLRNRSIQYNILQREVDTNRSLYDGLLQQYKEIGVTGALATNNVSIIDRPELPRAPSSPSYLMNGALGLLAGLLFAAAIIAVREIVDDTFKTPEEVEALLGVSVLGVIPLKRSTGDTGETGEVTREIATQPHSAIAEAYRSTRTALQFSTSTGVPKVLLVTSSQPGEGKSTTSFALAVKFGQIGMRVLLIDADLRKASLHRTLGVSNAAGLSNVLTGTYESSSVVQATPYENVTFISSGPLPPNPAELLAGPEMASMLSVASERFDIVMIDGPPIMGLADAPLLGSLAGGTLMVVDVGRSRRRMVITAAKRLLFARTRLLGVLVTKFDSERGGHAYGYGYGYGYGGLEYFQYGERPEELPTNPSDAQSK